MNDTSTRNERAIDGLRFVADILFKNVVFWIPFAVVIAIFSIAISLRLLATGEATELLRTLGHGTFYATWFLVLPFCLGSAFFVIIRDAHEDYVQRKNNDQLGKAKGDSKSNHRSQNALLVSAKKQWGIRVRDRATWLLYLLFLASYSTFIVLQLQSSETLSSDYFFLGSVVYGVIVLELLHYLVRVFYDYTFNRRRSV